MGRRSGRLAASVRTGAFLLVAATALAACQNKSASLDADPLATASTNGTGTAGAPSFKRTEELAKKWQANPSDEKLATAYAENLGALGQRQTQVGVLVTLAERNPTDPALQIRAAKQLLKLGEGQSTEAMMERASKLSPQDWNVYSTWGMALDQQTKHSDAREKYQQALALQPGELSVTNNMAMSYALQGKLPEAEKLLREAIAAPGAKALPRIRQNLALVVGLQGRFDESQKIASEDLPPDEVESNLAYLKQMLSRPNTWQQLQDNGDGQSSGQG